MFVSTTDGKDVVEITGVIVDLTDDTTGKKSFTFTITKTQQNAAEFDLLINDNILYIDERKFNHQKYYITDVDLKQSKNVITKTITANHIYSVLLVENRVEETVSKKLKLKEALDIALKGTDFTYVLEAPESDFPSAEEENFGEKNSTELMDQIIEDYDLEIDVDNYKIHVYKKMGQEVDFTLDSRYNMPGINIKTNSQTAPLGRGDTAPWQRIAILQIRNLSMFLSLFFMFIPKRKIFTRGQTKVGRPDKR